MKTRSFTQFKDFETWARERAADLAMEVEECGLEELAPDWIDHNEGGVLRRIVHRAGLFFYVGGVRILRAAGVAVRRWVQPMLFQPSGYVGLIVELPDRYRPSETETMILVRLFAEPGNKGIKVDGVNTRVLAGPPIQFSPGNIENHKKALRGESTPDGQPYKQVPFVSVALDEPPSWVKSFGWESAVEDGGRFFEKVNQYGLFTVRSRDDVESEISATGQLENFAWVSLSVWRKMREAGMINGHMRSISSMLV